MKRIIFSAIAIASATAALWAQQPREDNILDALHGRNTEAVYPEEDDAEESVEAIAGSPTDTLATDATDPVYDSLLNEWYDKSHFMVKDALLNNDFIVDSLYVPVTQIPDSVYEARLKMIGSAIPLSYNDVVNRHIVAYTTTKRKTMSSVMGRSLYYFPIFEAELDAQQLPLELRMLPVVESTLVPKARSNKGATGLWQFMYGTGKGFGLQITSFVDQRCDPVLATKAACRYLKSLYDLFGDWNLALAAYNCGPGNVNKAIKRADGKRNFWEIYPYLPKETRNYVPSFIAATYAYTFYKQHDIVPDEATLPPATDTLQINRIMHFEQISSTIDTPLDVIRALNPQYKLDIVPAVKGRTYSLVLPQTAVSKFLDNEAAILAKDTTYMAEYLSPAKTGKIPQFVIDSKTHTVRSGENLSSIARKYNVTVKQIIKWNNIKNPSKIKIGQKLEIFL